MVAEAVPRPALLPKLPEGVWRWQSLNSYCSPCQRLASLPNHEAAAARIVVALRTPSTQLRRPCDAPAWPQSKAEQVNVHGPHAAGTRHVTG